jgi:predicted RNase H-like HicB family nuclease
MKVREVIKLIEEDGWFLVATRGQSQAIQAFNEGWSRNRRRKTIGRFGTWDVEQHSEAGWAKRAALMRYAIVIEKADGNYSAYVPDLPGCVAAAPTVEAVEQEIRDAIRFHIEGLKADGLEVPPPTSIAEYVDA